MDNHGCPVRGLIVPLAWERLEQHKAAANRNAGRPCLDGVDIRRDAVQDAANPLSRYRPGLRFDDPQSAWRRDKVVDVAHLSGVGDPMRDRAVRWHEAMVDDLANAVLRIESLLQVGERPPAIGAHPDEGDCRHAGGRDDHVFRREPPPEEMADDHAQGDQRDANDDKKLIDQT